MNLILVPTIFLPLTGSIQSNDEITLSALNFVALGILILFSAFASGSEAAFFSIGPKEKEQLKNDESKSSQLVLKLLENPKELLATLLITNNFVNVGIVILSSTMLNNYLGTAERNETIRFLVEIVRITFMLLLLGEVIPKIYSTKNALRIARARSEEHTSELQSHHDLVCRLLLEKKKNKKEITLYQNLNNKIRIKAKY